MARNNEYLLKRIVDIQNTTLEYKAKGCSQKWIYLNVVRDKHFISESTYRAYLCRNAKKELADRKK